MICKKCNAIFVGDTCPFCGTKSLEDIKERVKTPSDLDIPIFLMCPPIQAEIRFLNNEWMEDVAKEEGEIKVDLDLFTKQWLDLYTLLSQEALVLTLPPKPGLQDLTFVNSFVYLPHVDIPTCIVSNFRAEGREPEADVADWFLAECGYQTYRIPNLDWHFEGEAELKYLRDNIYIGHVGVRTDEEALDWIAKTFDANIIKIRHNDDKEAMEYLYHGDCIYFPITPNDVILCTDVVDKKSIKELEKVANVIPVSKELAYQGICNSISVGYTIYNADNSDAFEVDSDDFKIEMQKNDTLVEIASQFAMEVVFVSLTEALKLGALLSCMVSRLNYSDKFIIAKWFEYGNHG